MAHKKRTQRMVSQCRYHVPVIEYSFFHFNSTHSIKEFPKRKITYIILTLVLGRPFFNPFSIKKKSLPVSQQVQRNSGVEGMCYIANSLEKRRKS
jgi:hypothetical protein